MAFNPIEYLEKGKTDFVFNLTFYDEKNLIERVRNHPRRIDIIDGFLDKLKNDAGYFCLKIIYDIDKYEETTKSLLNKYSESFFDYQHLKSILYNTSWGRDYVLEHLDEIIKYDIDYLNIILIYVFDNISNNKEFIKKMYLHSNLHVRFLFMRYLIDEYGYLINDIYDDLSKYLTSYTHQDGEQMTFLPDLMDKNDISELAVSCLIAGEKELWFKIKEFILTNYKENDIAELLLGNKLVSTKKKEDVLFIEYKKDADTLFKTSANYRFEIMNHYSKYVSNELINDLMSKLSMFTINSYYDPKLRELYRYDLGLKLEKYIDKYFSMSKDKTWNYVASGSMSSCYRIGDFAFKLARGKWSYEDIICPDLYLILKNLEEFFVRDKKGAVITGFEIQPYLTRTIQDIDPKYLSLFNEEMSNLGYYVNDSLINGTCGNNVMLLDSYKDADYRNVEKLPDWFKEFPLVLVDRDRVYEKGKKFIKQFGEGSW